MSVALKPQWRCASLDKCSLLHEQVTIQIPLPIKPLTDGCRWIRRRQTLSQQASGRQGKTKLPHKFASLVDYWGTLGSVGFAANTAENWNVLLFLRQNTMRIWLCVSSIVTLSCWRGWMRCRAITDLSPYRLMRLSCRQYVSPVCSHVVYSCLAVSCCKLTWRWKTLLGPHVLTQDSLGYMSIKFYLLC